MPGSKSDSAASAALSGLTASSIALINQFRTSLTTSTTAAPTIDQVPYPLEVLRDAARLVKAHTTKIGLLAINKPFTPSAISKVIREILSGCLPAMIRAVQACEQQKSRWTAMMASEAQIKVQVLLLELAQMLKEVEAINQGKSGSGGRDSLSSTGIVWQSCDAIVALEQNGPAGVAIVKVEQYRDTMQDAIEELDEWRHGEGDPNTEGKDPLLDIDDEAVDGDHDSIEDVFNAQNAMPADRPDIEKLLDDAESKLKKITLLFAAIIKRRLKTFPNDNVAKDHEQRIQKLDRLNQLLRAIPDQVDDLAAAFYSLDNDAISTALADCVQLGIQSIDLVERNWDGAEDQFSVWSQKWREAMT